MKIGVTLAVLARYSNFYKSRLCLDQVWLQHIYTDKFWVETTVRVVPNVYFMIDDKTY